jgi:glycine/D-amino acid oxidase-like deaminating enzyme
MASDDGCGATRMTKYGCSPWVDRFPRARVPSYPRLRGPIDTTVVIVGGGLTGCATAYALAARGVKVVVIDADRLGRGSSGSSSGWISDDPGVSFVDLQKTRGLRAAGHAWRTWRRAALDFAALLRRLDVKCHVEARETITVAIPSPHGALLLRELKARRAAGFDASAVAARVLATELALDAGSGVRTRDGATVDPYRACLGLAAAAAERGAALFERSPATRIAFGRRGVEVQTEGGRIRADRVIVATGVPTTLFKPLVRHFWFRTAYLAITEPLPAAVRRRLGRRAAVLRDASDPAHLVRWIDDERLLVAGADQETPPAGRRDKAIVQRTGQLMYELSTLYPEISGVAPAYGCGSAYARAADGLPFLGPHRNYPHHLFAFADASHGVTGAYLASRVLLRHHLGCPEPADHVFGFPR